MVIITVVVTMKNINKCVQVVQQSRRVKGTTVGKKTWTWRHKASVILVLKSLSQDISARKFRQVELQWGMASLYVEFP